MFDANEVINGLYGFVYDENGKQMQETKAFEANVDYDKEEVLQAGKLMKGHKVIAASGAGTITAHKIDSRLQRKAADNPHAKYNFYNFTDVQNKVNELLNKNVPTPSKPQNTGVTKVVAGSGAASFDKSLAGSYVTTTGLYMRHGAGKNKRAMVLIPEGTKVQNYGYYTSYNGTKWLYIQVTLNGVQYTGFSSKTYLKKQ